MMAVRMMHAAANMPVMIIVSSLRLPAVHEAPSAAVPPVPLDVGDAKAASSTASSQVVEVEVPDHRNCTTVSIATQFQKIWHA